MEEMVGRPLICLMLNKVETQENQVSLRSQVWLDAEDNSGMKKDIASLKIVQGQLRDALSEHLEKCETYNRDNNNANIEDESIFASDAGTKV